MGVQGSGRLLVFALLVAALFAPLMSAARPAASSSTALLPNLTPLPASEIQVSVLADGTKLLRFSTTSANLGDGPFEIRGGQTTGDSQQINQRVYNSDGTWTDSPAGFMSYHPTHGHMHVDDYATYMLESETEPGKSVRSGSKQTFCIIDTDRINHRLPGAPKRAVYTTCGTQVQGMSVGWGDTYRYYLDGQSIDITGLPDGDYRLIIQIDPKNRFQETDKSDNSSTVRIRLAGNSVSVISGGGGPGNGNGRPPR